MNNISFLCRVLSVQRRKNVTFLYISGFSLTRQLMIDNTLFEIYLLKKADIVSGKCSVQQNEKGYSVFKIERIEKVVSGSEMPSINFTNKAVEYKKCVNEVIQESIDYLRKNDFSMHVSPFTIAERSTSIASPLQVRGVYVDKYIKITHELGLKRCLCETLNSVFEIGYVARDVYNTVTNWFEYLVLEFVSPHKSIDFVKDFICFFIESATRIADKYSIKHLDFEDYTVVDISQTYPNCDEKQWKLIKIETKNTIFLNAPVDSPLVKEIDGVRSETIWIYNGKSMAHGYVDENDWKNYVSECNRQKKELECRGIEAEIPEEFISVLKAGLPDSISLGFGIDRFFLTFFAFENFKEYREIFKS